MRVSDILRTKGEGVVTLPPTASIQEVLDTLADHSIGSVVIVEGSEVVGILSERDIVRSARTGLHPEDAASTLMTTKVYTCAVTDKVEKLATIMTERRIRHLPVLEEGELVALVSIGDIVKTRLADLEAERDHLRDYLHS